MTFKSCYSQNIKFGSLKLCLPPNNGKTYIVFNSVVCLSVCHSFCLSVCLSVCPPAHMFDQGRFKVKAIVQGKTLYDCISFHCLSFEPLVELTNKY